MQVTASAIALWTDAVETALPVLQRGGREEAAVGAQDGLSTPVSNVNSMAQCDSLPGMVADEAWNMQVPGSQPHKGLGATAAAEQFPQMPLRSLVVLAGP